MIRPVSLFSIGAVLVAVLLVGCDETSDDGEPIPSAAGQAEASPATTSQAEPSPSVVSQAESNRRLAFVSNRDGAYRLYTMDPDGGDIRMLSAKTVSPLPFSVSRDGTQVAALGGDVSGNPSPCVYRVDVLGGSTELIGQVPPEAAGPPVMPPHWQADDGAVLIGGDEGCYEVPSGGGEVREKSGVGCLKAVVLAEGPQGKLAAVGPKGLEVFERLGSTPQVLDGAAVSRRQGDEGLGWDAVLLMAMQRMGALRPLWSPDGERIAYLRYDPDKSQSSIAVIRAEGGEPRVLVPPGRGSSDIVLPATWSPDGKRVIFAGFEEPGAIQEVSVDDGSIRTLAGDDGYSYYFPQWVTEAPAPERPGTPDTASLWTTCGAGAESATDLPMFFLSSVDAARDAGLPVYWLGTSFEAGDVLFALNEGEFPEGIAGVALQGLEIGYSSQPQPAGTLYLQVFSKSDWEQVKDKVLNPPVRGATHTSASLLGAEADLVAVPGGTRPLNLLELIVDLGDVVVVAHTNSGGPVSPGGPDYNPFINNPDLLVQVMQDLRPYPE